MPAPWPQRFIHPERDFIDPERDNQREFSMTSLQAVFKRRVSHLFFAASKPNARHPQPTVDCKRRTTAGCR
jgi:hypothetical protein